MRKKWEKWAIPRWSPGCPGGSKSTSKSTRYTKQTTKKKERTQAAGRYAEGMHAESITTQMTESALGGFGPEADQGCLRQVSAPGQGGKGANWKKELLRRRCHRYSTDFLQKRVLKVWILHKIYGKRVLNHRNVAKMGAKIDAKATINLSKWRFRRGCVSGASWAAVGDRFAPKSPKFWSLFWTHFGT